MARAEAAKHAAGSLAVVGPVTGWLAYALVSAATGLVVGGAVVGALHFRPRKKNSEPR